MSHLLHCHKENTPWPQEAHGDLPEGLSMFLNPKLLCSQIFMSFILCASALILTCYIKTSLHIGNI